MPKADSPALSPRQIPPELSAKYSLSGPRYTSYPTAPQFLTDFDQDAIAAKWRASNGSGHGLSLYLHIPFCRSRCLYCGCHTTICHDQTVAERYLDAMFREIDQVTGLVDPKRPLQQLALGGGSPTFLTTYNMTRLITRLKERFSFDPSGERSLEIDPESVDLDYLSALHELGFNRFSFGVQDFNPAVQKAVGRRQDGDGIRAKISHLRELGHQAINIDLIYGLPLQTAESFAETIATTVDIRPSRIALFGYAHVPWVSPHQKALERYELPNPAQRMELFGLAFEQLLDAGYRHVGMDHFALPEDELITALESRSLTRNFMGYSTRRGLDLAGLGASSISFVGTTFTQNVKEVEQYVEQAGGPIWIKGLEQTDEDRLRGEVILELMCNFFLDIPTIELRHNVRFSEHFASELKSLLPLIDDGLVVVDESAIEVTQLGRFFVRNIAMTFDEYLPGEAASEQRYSKTV